MVVCCSVIHFVLGSQLYDVALYLMAVSLIVLLCCLTKLKLKFRNEKVISIAFPALKVFPSLPNEKELQRQYPKSAKLFVLCNSFVVHLKFILLLVFVIIIFSIPMLVLRLFDTDNDYSSHWNTYSWTLSFSYLDGKLMGALSLSVWALATASCSAYIIMISRAGRDKELSITHEQSTSDVAREAKWCSFKNLRVVLAFIGNLLLTLSVNVLYILSTTDKSLSTSVSLLIRFAMSLFRTVSSATIVPFLANQVTNKGQKSLFMFRLIMFNNILIPCVVTALTSSNCYQVSTFGSCI